MKIEKTKIPSKAEIRVDWLDLPHNFSKEGEKTIRANFAKKYNIDLKKIKVIQVPLKLNKEGKKVVWTDGLVENVLNLDNQRLLYKQWLEIEGITDYNWDKIIELDDLANSLITNSVTDENCGLIWEPVELGLSNFLSFGENIVINWKNYNGVTLVTSEPANTGGKTNLIVDAPYFACFGVTTKTDKNEEIFNLFSDKNEVVVYFVIKALGETYKIVRTLNRKEKRAGGYNITNKVQYYKVYDGGAEIELVDDEEMVENKEGEQARETNKLIKNLIGSRDDFENIICATSKTLDNIIDSKVIGPTDRGKLLNKFIGLEVFDKKYVVINEERNIFKKTMKSNIYTVTTLESEIEERNGFIKTNNETITLKENEIVEKDKIIKALIGQRDILMQSKHQIDADILKLDSNTLQQNIKTDTDSGILKKTEKETKIKEKEGLMNLVFDKEAYNKLIEDDKTKSIEQSNLLVENRNLTNENQNLENAQICPILKTPCKELVNNTDKIQENKLKIIENNKKLEILTSEIEKIKIDKANSDIIKEGIEQRDRLDLAISKLDVDMGSLREKILANRVLLKKYEENKENIDKNNEIDIKLQSINANITTEETHKSIINNETIRLKGEITQYEKEIKEKTALIEDINKEEIRLKEYNLYLSLVESKRGVGKIVLKNTLPVINYTINEMLGDEVCDFDVELDLNASNEVEIYIVKDDIKSKIKGGSGFESFAVSLALRVVFSRLSTLPKPNFIILDEILGGKVAAINLEKVQLVIEKIKKYYQTIFFITHDERTKDWCDKIITIKKTDNISYIV